MAQEQIDRLFQTLIMTDPNDERSLDILSQEISMLDGTELNNIIRVSKSRKNFKWFHEMLKAEKQYRKGC